MNLEFNFKFDSSVRKKNYQFSSILKNDYIAPKVVLKTSRVATKCSNGVRHWSPNLESFRRNSAYDSFAVLAFQWRVSFFWTKFQSRTVFDCYQRIKFISGLQTILSRRAKSSWDEECGMKNATLWDFCVLLSSSSLVLLVLLMLLVLLVLLVLLMLLVLLALFLFVVMVLMLLWRGNRCRGMSGSG